MTRNRVRKGPEQGQKGAEWLQTAQKEPNTVHLRPNEPVQPYPTGTWIYPTLGPDHLGLALATGPY